MSEQPFGLCQCGCGQPAPIARRTDPRKGAVRGQPRRYIRGHHYRSDARYAEQDCGYTSPCWIWRWARNRAGYGVLRAPETGRTLLAHRAFYEELHGPIPEGAMLDHLCRQRACVNPAHLEPVSNRVNSLRGAKTKLSDAEVREIRGLLGVPLVEIAARFGITPTYASELRRGWRSRKDVV